MYTTDLVTTSNNAISGSCTFSESTPFFADNDLGDGAVAVVWAESDGYKLMETLAVLHWLDWNSFNFEGIGENLNDKETD